MDEHETRYRCSKLIARKQLRCRVAATYLSSGDGEYPVFVALGEVNPSVVVLLLPECDAVAEVVREVLFELLLVHLTQ